MASKKTRSFPSGRMKLHGKSNVSHTAKPGRSVPQGPSAKKGK
jgi:hypothetical protein